MTEHDIEKILDDAFRKVFKEKAWCLDEKRNG